MVQKCSAFGCLNKSKKNSGITFHKFPSIQREALRKKWINAMKRRDFDPGHYSKVCSDHFSLEDFQPTIKVKVLKRDAIPKVVIGGKKDETTNPRRVLKRVEHPTVFSKFACGQCDYPPRHNFQINILCTIYPYTTSSVRMSLNFVPIMVH